MIAPRLGNASISFASIGARPASTIALTEAPCSARKSSRPASTGSTSASYFAVRAAASGGGTSPTCRTVAAITPSSRRPLLRSLVVPTTRLRQICDGEHRAGQGALSHPWPGSPLHHRPETLVPGAGPPKAVRQLPTSFLTWPSGWKFQCWTIAPLHNSRCKTEVFSCCVRHFPGKAAFSSCWPSRFQRWKSESLQGFTTTGTSPIQLGASRQASPNRLRTWTGPSALAAPALCIAPPSAVLTMTRARPTPRINPSTRIYRYQHGQRWIAADYEFFIQTAVFKSVWLVFGVAWAGPSVAADAAASA